MPNSTATKQSVSGLERSQINIQIKSKGSYTKREVQFKRHTETLVVFRTCISKNATQHKHVLTWVFNDANDECSVFKVNIFQCQFLFSNSILGW